MEYDQAGHRDSAERLRIAASHVGGVGALDQLDAQLDRLLKPDPTAYVIADHISAPVELPPPAPQPSLAAADNPVSRAPGRPRKS